MMNFLFALLLLQGSFSQAETLFCRDLFVLEQPQGIYVGRAGADVYITQERLNHILQGEWTPDGRLRGGLHTMEGLEAFLKFRKSLGLDAGMSPIIAMSRPNAAFPSVFLDPVIFTTQAGEAVRKSYAGGFASRYGKSLFPRGYNEKKIITLIKAAVGQIDPEELRSIEGTKQFRLALDITPPNLKHKGRFLFTLIIDRNQQVITFFPDGHQTGTSLSPIMAQNQPYYKLLSGEGGRMSQLSKKEIREINDYFSQPSLIFEPIQFSAEQVKHIPHYVLTLVRSGVNLKALEVFFDRPEITTVKENYRSLRLAQIDQLAQKTPEFANEVVKYIKFLMANSNSLASVERIFISKKKTLNINHFLTETNLLEALQLLFALERNGAVPKGTALQIVREHLKADRKDTSWVEVATFLKIYEICIENIKGDLQQLSAFLTELPRYPNYWILIHQPSSKSIQK